MTEFNNNAPCSAEEEMYPAIEPDCGTRIKADPSKPAVSKTLAMKCAQCPKACFLHINMRGLEADITASTQNKFDVGNDVGELAQQLFPGGVEVKADRQEIYQALNLTQQYIEDGQTIIYEATAMDKEGLYAKADILTRDGSGWILNEVKSASDSDIKKNLAKEKLKGSAFDETHLTDIAVQLRAFEGAGFKINGCNLIVLNNEYIKNGDIDVNQLFSVYDVTEDVAELDINQLVEDTFKITKTDDEPIVKVGPQCNKPYDCVYTDHCWASIPKYSIFDVLTKKKAVDAENTTKSYKIENLTEGFKPSIGTLKAIDVDMYGKEETHVDTKQHIHKKTKLVEGLKLHLDELQYPLFYLDYETFMPAIPIFDKSGAYDQIPFQFSLHIQNEPGGEVVHHEFLHKEKTDPREAFAKKLVELCKGTGSVIVYNQTFEKSRNKDLAEIFPQYADALMDINDRMWDLMTPFSKRWIYNAKQKSSASIKYVLPAYTDLSYDGMGIANGLEAMIMMENFVKGNMTDEDGKKMLDDLHEYCKLDTWAMVVLLEKVVELVDQKV